VLDKKIYKGLADLTAS